MVTQQNTGYVTQQTHCPKCGKIQSRKGKHEIVLRTLFGKLRLDSPRLYHCGCCSKEECRSFSPLADLLTERTASELTYLENKFAAVICYGLTVELLAEVLPTGGDINVAGVYPKCARCSRTDGSRIGRRKVAIYRWVSARLGYAASAGPTINRRARRWLYPRQGPEVPRGGLVRSHRWQEHARGRRSEMLCLRAELRHKAEAPFVRIYEITKPPGQSAG